MQVCAPRAPQRGSRGSRLCYISPHPVGGSQSCYGATVSVPSTGARGREACSGCGVWREGQVRLSGLYMQKAGSQGPLGCQQRCLFLAARRQKVRERLTRLSTVPASWVSTKGWYRALVASHTSLGHGTPREGHKGTTVAKTPCHRSRSSLMPA